MLPAHLLASFLLASFVESTLDVFALYSPPGYQNIVNYSPSSPEPTFKPLTTGIQRRTYATFSTGTTGYRVVAYGHPILKNALENSENGYLDARVFLYAPRNGQYATDLLYRLPNNYDSSDILISSNVLGELKCNPLGDDGKLDFMGFSLRGEDEFVNFDMCKQSGVSLIDGLTRGTHEKLELIIWVPQVSQIIFNPNWQVTFRQFASKSTLSRFSRIAEAHLPISPSVPPVSTSFRRRQLF